MPISDLATEVICTEKANGEAAHISARYIGNRFYVIVGSKNVHLMLGKFLYGVPCINITQMAITQKICISNPALVAKAKMRLGSLILFTFY